ncbi:hypothetical protein AMATHDRAFT_1865 [Amanita thiersii Skay4041]|uniref:Uncharacterized protein n=1 Tax=Amanita thiersii Skay4041 TaxID=703135 RepID=A0A2A9NYC3_9AGAR|nr:hypothetical protein AMATHDRAFT_1865 [Amanita thiersii Skay4041]
MAYKGRNVYYLRLSRDSVIPLYVFLDDRHVDWMSDAILQKVLSDLHPHLASGAILNPSAKTDIVSIKGDTYQFCYFFRKADPHSLLRKVCHYFTSPSRAVHKPLEQSRHFITSPSRTSNIPTPYEAGDKRKLGIDDQYHSGEPRKLKKKHGRRQPDRPTNAMTLEDAPESADPSSVAYSRNTVSDEIAEANSLEIEIIEEKPKPQLQLSFQGFQLFDRCLCLVVEPWSADTSRPSSTDAISVDVAKERNQPLFLPDPEQSWQRHAGFQPESSGNGRPNHKYNE